MRAEINVTPLIDVLLVLLVIFMVVTPLSPTALDASLPKNGDGAPKGQAPPALVLEVRTDDFALNSSPILTLGELGSRLRAAFDTRGDRTLFVRVATSVRYERVVEALDAASGAGASRIGLVDETEAQP